VAVLVALVAGSPRLAALAAIATAGGAAGLRLWRSRRAASEAARTRDLVLDCCEALAAELASGQPPGTALVHAARTWSPLLTVAQAYAYGGDVPASLRRVAADEPGAEELRLVAAAWQVAHLTGQGLAEALARVGAGLRDARATRRVVAGELASARATARLVGALPVVALAMGTGSGGDPVGFLVGTPLGIACLAGGLAIETAGLVWIERIAADVSR
jgi:tight adherence protein B